MTHTLGTTCAGAGRRGAGSSGAVNDPVVCQGTIAAGSAGAINLNGSLGISASRMVELGSRPSPTTISCWGSAAGRYPGRACQFVTEAVQRRVTRNQAGTDPQWQLSLSRLCSGKQRRLRSYGRAVGGWTRVRRLFGHRSFGTTARTAQSQQLPLSGQQCRRQRRLCPQRRPVNVGSIFLGCWGPGELYPDRRQQSAMVHFLGCNAGGGRRLRHQWRPVGD